MLLFLCIKIFLVRIVDVSLGTLRTIMSVKNKNVVASLIGFFEVTVWFLIVREALNTNNNSLFIVFSYSLGFAVGTYVGGKISNTFIKSNLGVQIITNNEKIIEALRKEGYGVSVIDIKGQDKNNKFMLFVEISNKNFYHLRQIIRNIDKKAFVVVEETKYVFNGYIRK